MQQNGMHQEPKKEKTIKHGVIAVGAIVATLLFIVIGIYLYGYYRTPYEQTVPVQQNSTPT